MPAATTKADLMSACENEFAKLSTVIDGLDDKTAMRPFEDGLTIKDVVGHRAHWIDLWLGWEEAGRLGKPVQMPAEGYKWNELNALNAAVRKSQSVLSWHDAKTLLRDRHKALLARLDAMTEAELYGGPMIGGNGRWTAGRYAESAGSSHYRSAAKVIRGWLRSLPS